MDGNFYDFFMPFKKSAIAIIDIFKLDIFGILDDYTELKNLPHFFLFFWIPLLFWVVYFFCFGWFHLFLLLPSLFFPSLYRETMATIFILNTKQKSFIFQIIFFIIPILFLLSAYFADMADSDTSFISSYQFSHYIIFLYGFCFITFFIVALFTSFHPKGKAFSLKEFKKNYIIPPIEDMPIKKVNIEDFDKDDF